MHIFVDLLSYANRLSTGDSAGAFVGPVSARAVEEAGVCAANAVLLPCPQVEPAGIRRVQKPYSAALVVLRVAVTH